MKMCSCKFALGYDEETGCAVCGHDMCQYDNNMSLTDDRRRLLIEMMSKWYSPISFKDTRIVAEMVAELEKQEGGK